MIEYLTAEEVIAMHDAFLQEFGGLPGIRDINLLMSAIETPKSTMFGRDLYPTIYDKAAAYLYHIVCNHDCLSSFSRTWSFMGFLSNIVNNLLKIDENGIEINIQGMPPEQQSEFSQNLATQTIPKSWQKGKGSGAFTISGIWFTLDLWVT